MCASDSVVSFFFEDVRLIKRRNLRCILNIKKLPHNAYSCPGDYILQMMMLRIIVERLYCLRSQASQIKVRGFDSFAPNALISHTERVESI